MKLHVYIFLLQLTQVLRNQGECAIALVLAPTGDLANQTQEEAFKFQSCTSVINTCVYGAAPKGPQIFEEVF